MRLKKDLFRVLALLSVILIVYDFLAGDIWIFEKINFRILIFLSLLGIFALDFNFRFSLWDLCFFSFLLIVLLQLSFLREIDTLRAYTMLFGIILGWILSHAKLNKNQLELTIRYSFYILIIIVIAILFDYQILLKSYFNNSRSALKEGSGFNTFSLAILFHLLLITYLFKMKKNSVIEYLIIAILLIVTVIAKSRGPLVSLILVLFLAKKIRFKSFKAFMIPIVLSVCIYLLFISSALRNNGMKTVESRYILIENSLKLTSINPIGEGIGSFYLNYNYPYPHNIIVQYLTELGPIFTILLLLILFLITFALSKMKGSNAFIPSLLLYFFIWYNFSGDPMLGGRILFPLMGLSICIIKSKNDF